jgi:tryptophan synthase alpha chain
VTRIAECFAQLRAKSKVGLIAYLTAGDPDPSLTVRLMHALARAGADIIELGVPFSDPMADGPVIQRAADRAVRKGVGLSDCLAMARQFRLDDSTTPLVLMGYANPIERMGVGVFVDSAKAAGVDGAIVVDYPPEECQEYVLALKNAQMDPIFLLAPTSTEKRIETVAASAGGFIYYVSLKGITGAGNLDVDDVAARLPAIRAHSKLPLAVGFGIRDGQSARAVARVADAIVVGSRLVETIEAAGAAGNADEVVNAAARLMGEIRVAIDSK